MKSLLIGLFALGSITAFSATEIARIEERDSGRSLVYSQEKNELIFTIERQKVKNEIKRLSVNTSANSIELKGNGTYNFEIFKSMKKASSSSYHWCWVSDSNHELQPGLTGLDKFPIGIFVAAPAAILCATLPGMPFLAGLIVSPIDGIITLSNNLFDKDAIAARKFSKLLRQKSSKASAKVFESLVEQIKEL